MQQHILSLQAYSKSTSHTNQILSLPHHSQMGIYSNVPHATVAFWVGLHGMSGKMTLNSSCSAVTLQKKMWNRQHFSQHGPYDLDPNSLTCIWLGHCHNKADWERGICCLLPPSIMGSIFKMLMLFDTTGKFIDKKPNIVDLRMADNITGLINFCQRPYLISKWKWFMTYHINFAMKSNGKKDLKWHWLCLWYPLRFEMNIN